MITTSQVIVNVDSKLKSQAMKKAKAQGLPFSSVLNFAIRAFVDGDIEVGLVDGLNTKTRREIAKAEKDFSKDKNLSPRFSTVADARKWLDN